MFSWTIEPTQVGGEWVEVGLIFPDPKGGCKTPKEARKAMELVPRKYAGTKFERDREYLVLGGDWKSVPYKD